MFPIYFVEILAMIASVVFVSSVGIREETKKIIPRKPLLLRASSTHTCPNGHVCIATTSSTTVWDDIHQREIAPETSIFHCVECDYMTTQ